MKEHAGRVAVLLTMLLGAALVLLSIEWPMPVSAHKILAAELAKQSITLNYRAATFDLMGNIRLAGVDGRAQGLLEFTARQILLRPAWGGGFLLVFDKGELHTGFFQLPIPETIQFSGGLRQKGVRTSFRELRLRAKSLVMLLHGDYTPERKIPSSAKPAPAALSMGEGELTKPEKAFAAFLASLCNDNQLWVGDVQLRPGGGQLTLAGARLNVDQFSAQAPILQVDYPLRRLFVSADSFGVGSGLLKDVSVLYDADEGALWRVVAQSASYEQLNAQGISLSGRWPIALLADKSAASDIEGCAQLAAGATVSVAEGTLSPLSARLYGRAPSELLEQFGLKLETKKPGRFAARLRDQTLFFNFSTDAGRFYDLDYYALSTRGRLTLTGAQIDRFKMSAPGGQARGSLTYDFASKEASYTLVGKIDPLSLPWFGPEWNKAFEPLRGAQPWAAMSLRVKPGANAQATGIAGVVEKHHYQTLDLDKTLATYHFDDRQSKIDFHTFSQDEQATGQLSFRPVFSGTLQGRMLPVSLAKAYLPQTPEVLKHLYFASLPDIQAQLGAGGYTIQAQTPDAVRFYSLDFDGLKATVSSQDGLIKVDPVEFGFSGGRGGLTAQVNTDERGYGTVWVRDARLGEWGLLGPLSEMFKFTALKFNSLDGSFTLEPDRLNIDSLSLWGNEHAAQARGSINTADKTLDLAVKLKTLGGSRPTLGLLAPIVQPFTSLMEARLSGPLDKPVWKVQLSSPFAQ